MALIPIVTMKSATKSVDRMSITVNLKVNDGVADVIDKDFSASYRPGLDDGIKVDIEGSLQKQMQKEIDEYKAGNLETKQPAFVAIKTNLETNLKM
jgi:hypothetical protein